MNADVDISIKIITEAFRQAQAVIQDMTLPTRVLDDAFHFMDRLLRLLSKKHSAFKAFSHDFSEAIVICDKDDEAAVWNQLGVCEAFKGSRTASTDTALHPRLSYIGEAA